MPSKISSARRHCEEKATHSVIFRTECVDLIKDSSVSELPVLLTSVAMFFDRFCFVILAGSRDVSTPTLLKKFIKIIQRNPELEKKSIRFFFLNPDC